MLFLEKTSPPPFWQPQLTDKQRLMYDKAFIGNRSQAYYLKRFAQFDQAGRLTAKWHWAGFLMTFPWLLYRKRFLDSIVYSVAGWSFIQLNVTIILVAIEYLLIRNLDEAIRMPLRIGIGLAIWLFWSVMVLLVSAIAIVIAQNPDSKVLGLVSYAWAGFGAAFGPVVLMSLFWRRMTGTGALAGMLVGALTVIAWKPLTGSSLYEIVPGFILGMIAIYVVSLLTPASDKVMARFDDANKAYNAAR